MLITALSTGLRFGELIGLTFNDLDFKNSRIKVQRQWMYKEGRGFSDLKNESSSEIKTDETKIMVSSVF